MKRLRHRPHIAAEAARAAAGNADCGGGLVAVELEQPAHRHGGRDGADQADMPPAAVGRTALLAPLRVDDMREPSGGLVCDNKCVKKVAARKSVMLGYSPCG